MPQKAGIITFHCTDNPGSVLQAYALQQTVCALGYECDIINYQKQGWLEPLTDGFSQSIANKLHIPYCVARWIARCAIGRCYIKFDAFRSKYMRIFPKKPIHNSVEIEKLPGGGV